jgi:intracellular septation protein
VKPFADLFPVLVFFLTYFSANTWPEAARRIADAWLVTLVQGGAIRNDLVSILLASAAAILVITAQITIKLCLRRRIGPMQWLTFVIFVLFGGATIYFQDDTFIKWKPTVLYWSFAAGLIVAERFAHKNLMRSVIEPAGVSMPEPLWRKLNFAWAIFFLFVGGLNLFVAFHLSRDVWVSFKSFGLTGLTFAFAIGQSFFLAKHMASDEPEGGAS